MNPAALALRDAAALLSRLGHASITEAMLRADVEAGAPANGDGTLNLVHYCAWLVRAAADGGSHGPAPPEAG